MFKGRFTDPLLYAVAEGFNRLDHSSELIMMPNTGFQLTLLFGYDGQSLLQFLSPPFIFFELQHIGQIGIG